MNIDDFELVAQELDDLFGPDDLTLLPPLPEATNAGPFSAARFGELETPLPIAQIEVSTDNSLVVTDNESVRAQTTVSPATSTHSSLSSASGFFRSTTNIADDMERRLATYKTVQRRRITAAERIRVLQNEASQLEIELRDAQKRSRTMARARRLSNAGTDKSEESVCQLMWEPIAIRQQKYRERAEAENANLRRLVESQSRYLRSVQRAIGRQPNREEVNCVVNGFNTASHRLENQDADAHTFRVLLSRIDNQYARVGPIWSAHGISDLPCPGRRWLTSIQTIRDDVRIELINRASVPFKMEAVEQVVWSYLAETRLRQPTVQTAKLVDYRNDTLQLRLTLKNNYDGLQSVQTNSSVTRKFVERNCVVFVSLSLVEPSVQNLKTIEGTKFIATVVRVLKPGDMLPDGSQATIIESFWSTRGYDVDGMTKCPPWKFEPFRGIARGAMEGAMTREYEAIEDLLVRMPFSRSPVVASNVI